MNQLLSVRTDIKNTQLPRVEDMKSVPENSSIDFHAEKGNYYIINILTSPSKLATTRIVAKVLAEHIEIVEESRKHIVQGNTTTWEQFVKTHVKSKRK